MNILGVLKYHQGISSLQKGKKKFILSKYVIFLESTQNDNNVEWQLDNFDRFIHVKTYQEFDNEIPHLEGWIPILDQFMESPFEVPSPPHVEDPTTSS